MAQYKPSKKSISTFYPAKLWPSWAITARAKSTLVKGIAGIYGFDEGEVLFDGQPVHIHSPRDASTLGIEVVYQDLALADNLDVVANMFLGRDGTP